MKKVFYILAFSLILVAGGVAQEEAQTTYNIDTDLVSVEVIGGNTIIVYKRNSKRIPFFVKVSDSTNHTREFFVIEHVSDMYNYLIIERRNGEVLYYPFVWTDLASIKIKDINERSFDIISGKVRSVRKENL